MRKGEGAKTLLCLCLYNSECRQEWSASSECEPLEGVENCGIKAIHVMLTSS